MNFEKNCATLKFSNFLFMILMLYYLLGKFWGYAYPAVKIIPQGYKPCVFWKIMA